MMKIIRYRGNKCFCSSDNWKTYEVLTRRMIDAEEEKDADIITKMKFRYELGDDRADLIISELNDIREMFDMQSADGYGHPFEVFSISVLYNIDYNSAFKNYIVNGKNDGKIDAIYWRSDLIYLYQIKLDMVDASVKDKMKHNHNEFLDTGNLTSPNTEDLLEFYKRNKDNIPRTKNFKIITISSNLDNENNYTPFQICQMYFENQIQFLELPKDFP